MGFLTSLGVDPRNVIFSSDTSEEQGRQFGKGRGTVDCCYPVKCISGHYGELLFGQRQKLDVLLSPTSPTVAFRIGEKATDPLAMYVCDVLTIPPNMAGLPGLSIPCGLSEGLPVGLQLLGRQFSENLLFRVGHALEQAIGFDAVPERLR